MPLIELQFPVRGGEIPTDHAYSLYGAISRIIPAVHTGDRPLRIGPIRGAYVGNGKLRLDPRGSQVRIRVSPDDLPLLLPLAGKSLDLDGHPVRVGVPQVSALVPAPTLIARLVVIKASSPLLDPADKRSRDRTATKRYLDPAVFLDAVRRDLARRGVRAQADLPVHPLGDRQGQPRRHVVRIHGKAIVGYAVIVQGLAPEASVCLQEEGIGGRSKVGCGFFVPFNPKESRRAD